MNKNHSLEVVDLECVRGDQQLFARLNFVLEAGNALQVEGTNGSGKTSLLRLLCGLSMPESGVIKWCDQDIRDCRTEYQSQLTYVGHIHGIKDDLTAVENLDMIRVLGASNNMSAQCALDQVGLNGYEHAYCRYMSAGQRRRVALARLLISNASLWILDEPLTAIDKQGVSELEQVFRDHVSSGGSLIITSHQPVKLDNTSVQTLHLNK